MSNETNDNADFTQPGDDRPTNACRTAEELAAEAVRIAKQELEKAQKFYEDVRRQATEKFQEVREKKVGDLIDCTIGTVKKHPGPSMVVSVALGFCMGRWIQKFLGR